MSNTQKRPFAQAHSIAQLVTVSLIAYCERLEIAGSLRRQKAMVGDIELVAIPKREIQAGLFSDDDIGLEVNLLHKRLDKLLAEGIIQKGRAWGALNRQFTFVSGLGHTYKVDVYMCESANWGNILTIRTGSAEFGAHLMAWLNGRGFAHKNGRLVDSDGVIIDCPTEERFFDTIEHPFLPPEQRSNDLWQRALIRYGG